MHRIPIFFTATLLAAILFGMGLSSQSPAMASAPGVFSFVSLGDAQGGVNGFAATLNQAASLQPDLVLFNGDLEINGVTSSEMNSMVGDLQTSGLFDRTFLVRGNHDNHQPGSASLWEDFFTASNRSLPAGVSNYVAMDSGSTYLTYSFDYGNSRFIGVDDPGGIVLITDAEYAFIDQRLTGAELLGLAHAFIFFHGPEYCVEAMHCDCSSTNDGSCTPPQFIDILNRHPVVSATFHGHEHILGWVHMDSRRISNLANSYEEFLTSPSGGETHNAFLFPARVDYVYMDMGSSQGFAAITVDGYSYTFSIYKNGTAAPVWSQTFTDIPYSTPQALYLPLVVK